jgi:polysaccharide biosynthesis/export protein
MLHFLRHVRPAQLFSLMVISALALPAPVTGQSIDSSILRDVQQQLGKSGTSISTSTPSALDRSRERNDQSLPSRSSESGEVRDQLEAARLRGQLDRAYVPTPIEQDMRLRSGNNRLRQFGYDLFNQNSETQAPITGQIDDRYILGVGDELVVMFQGSTNRSTTTRIDREGRLVADQLRPIPAAGRPLGSVRRDLEAATRATLLGTDVYLSVGSVRAISVIVGGEVRRPGSLTLNSLSDVTAAIVRAGGVRPNGSLRRIKVVGAGGTRLVDLYGLLGLGAPPQVRLRDGDRIIVPALGNSIAISGSVGRPGIYELPAGASMTVRTAVSMAGGALRPNGNDVVLNRIGVNGAEEFATLRNFNQSLKAGDVIIINPRERGANGRVTLSGFVDTPGSRSLNVAPTVQALLGSPENMKPSSYLPMGVLVRIDPVTRARQFRAVDLVAALTRGRDVSLRPEDELIVLSTNDVRFMQSDIIRQVVLGQSSTKFKCTSLQTLADLVRNTQSDRFSSVIRGALLVDRNGKTSAGSGGNVSNRLGVRDTESLSKVNSRASKDAEQMNESGDMTDTDDASQQTPATTNASEILDTQLKLEEKTEAMRLRGQTVDGCPLVFENDSSILPFMIEHSAQISGAVRRPGAYPVAADSNLSTVVAVAEGLTLDAEAGVAEITSDTAVDGRQLVDLTTTRMVDVAIRPGDDIRFRSKQPVMEPGAILLSGEFRRPGLYSIRKGETLAQLIARAGGVTEQSYPYGAVFTRRSVRLAQQEGFKRSSRELSQALLTVSARRQLSGDTLAAASALAKSFASTEAPGRVVVEADPRVLERRPDLDTQLEPGDAILMPKKPNFILSTGDFLNPTAMQFIPGKTVSSYIKESGGFQETADKKRVFIVYPNGVAQSVSAPSSRSKLIAIPPGSAIVAPKNVDPLRKLDTLRDIGTLVSQFASTIASLAVLARGL